MGRDATRVGAIVFSENVQLVFSLDRFDSAGAVQQAISNIVYMGQTTNTPAALTQVLTECFNTATGDRPNVQNLAVMVTDGVPYPPNRRDPAINAAAALRNSGVNMVAIGVTPVIDEAFLKQMSSPPQMKDQNYFTAADFSQLGNIIQDVVAGTCDAIVAGKKLALLIFGHLS